jgi:hypothetical protein
VRGGSGIPARNSGHREARENGKTGLGGSPPQLGATAVHGRRVEAVEWQRIGTAVSLGQQQSSRVR